MLRKDFSKVKGKKKSLLRISDVTNYLLYRTPGYRFLLLYPFSLYKNPPVPSVRMPHSFNLNEHHLNQVTASGFCRSIKPTCSLCENASLISLKWAPFESSYSLRFYGIVSTIIDL